MKKSKKVKTARQLLGRGKDKRLGWHLISEDMVLQYGGKKVRKGQRAVMKTRASLAEFGKPSVCQQGMHASHVPHKTMKSVGRMLCRVLVEGDITDYSFRTDYWGNIRREEKHKDKFAGRYRTILWMKKIPDHLWKLSWGLYENTTPGVGKKLLDWARENGAPYADHDSFGRKK